MVSATLALDEPALQAIVDAIIEHDLWDEVLLIAEHDDTIQERLGDRLAALPARRRREVAQRARDATTAYMVAYFLGGAALSAVTAALSGSAGWGGVCILGAATALLALAVWGVSEAARGRAHRSEAHDAVCAGAGD